MTLKMDSRLTDFHPDVGLVQTPSIGVVSASLRPAFSRSHKMLDAAVTDPEDPARDFGRVKCRTTPARRKSQVALLSARIESLSGHFATHAKDHHRAAACSRWSISAAACWRTSKATRPTRYKTLIERLGIRR